MSIFPIIPIIPKVPKIPPGNPGWIAKRGFLSKGIILTNPEKNIAFCIRFTEQLARSKGTEQIIAG